MFYATYGRRLSWNTGTVQNSCKMLCHTEPIWSPDQKITKACWDQGYSLQCCRDFKVKEIRFLMRWALHPLLSPAMEAVQPVFFLSWTIYPVPLWSTIQNLKHFCWGFLCSPLILSKEVEVLFFLIYMVFFPPQVLWYDSFLFPSFGGHLGIRITSAVKKNPKSILLVTNWSCGIEFRNS